MADVIDTYGWCPVCGGDTVHETGCRLVEGWALLDDENTTGVVPGPQVG